MSKRTIEIEDSLYERADMAIQETEELLLQFLEENPDTDELPCLANDLDYSGSFHEIVDGSVPVYTHEIESTWFLHSGELEEAYSNAGVGDDARENYGMAAIYYYIEQKCWEWYNDNAEDIFDEWLEKREEENDDE